VRVAIVGGGVSGLVCAHLLHPHHEVTVFEAEGRLGGHTNTVRVDLADETHYVDTGFIVFNDRNYPLFSTLLDRLGVPSQPSTMSFSVSATDPDLEYRGNGWRLYAQPANALRPEFQRLLVDVLRFNHRARRLLGDRRDTASLGDFVRHGRYGDLFASHYLVPLGSAIWSADPTTFDAIPATTVASFFDHHGMLALKGRPEWRTVSGGSSRYVEALVRPFRHRVRLGSAVEKVTRRGTQVLVMSAGQGEESFDAVVMAAHSDQALKLLSDPSPTEREVLGAISYRDNVATLHTDVSLLPRRRAAWAAWNYHRSPELCRAPTVTYWMNCLQRLRSSAELLVTLNREHEIDPHRVLGQWRYAHPVFDQGSVRAQRRLGELQGRRGTFYCGAYWGYGFHEDGVRSGVDVARLLGARDG
jgi:predicted NAD/FAD-binding protein